MSLREFWSNVRSAAAMITPTVTADSPRINHDQIERILRRAAIWLTPRAVEGFEERDFDFLNMDERVQLSEAVRLFRDVAVQVDPKQPARPEQMQAALPYFQRIVEILGSNKYSDSDAFMLGKSIERHIAGRVPNTVLELRFETGDDSSGDAGLWVWVVLDDRVADDDEELLANTSAIEQLITDAVRQLGIRRWPYVRFRTNSDLEPLQADG